MSSRRVTESGTVLSQFFNQQIGRQRRFLVECAIQGCDHSLFDFRAAEAVAGADDLDQIEMFCLLLPKTQVNLPDGFPLGLVRQVHKKDFIESAFAKEFGGKHGKIVGGGHDEDLLLLFLKPREKRAEQPAAQSRIGLAASAPAAMAFSISSIHRTMGESDSAISIALRKFFSDSPTNLSNNRPGVEF